MHRGATFAFTRQVEQGSLDCLPGRGVGFFVLEGKEPMVPGSIFVSVWVSVDWALTFIDVRIGGATDNAG